MGRIGPLVVLFAFSCLSGAPPASSDSEPLGTVHFPVSCSAAVQPQFDRAVALLHHMTYPEARKAFAEIAILDPRCAMAHWGVAMTLFQPLWPTRPGAGDLQRGWEEVGKAKALAPPTARERAYVDTMEVLFRDPESADYWSRIRRWADALQKVHAGFPDDREASALFALALLATATPPTAAEHSQRAAALLLPIYRENPTHPGAMHYLVHADDVAGREREHLDVVHRYEEVAPDNPHALHMPTHIYTRLGDWDGVVRGNLKAAEAALRHPAGDHGELVWDEFPHAIEYLVYAYLQQGADESAAAQIERLFATPRLEPTAKTAFHLASTRARYALERHAWAEAAALVPREPAVVEWDRFPWPEAVAWFARGLGAAHTGADADARQAAERLTVLEAAATRSGEDVFARQIRVLGLELSSWLAHVRKDEDAALALMRQAVELDESTPKPPVTPAGTLPAAELLGDLFSERGLAGEALLAYERSLRMFPRRFNSLLGAARAARTVRDDARAPAAYRELLEVAAHGSRAAVLSEARQFLSTHD